MAEVTPVAFVWGAEVTFVVRSGVDVRYCFFGQLYLVVVVPEGYTCTVERSMDKIVKFYDANGFELFS